MFVFVRVYDVVCGWNVGVEVVAWGVDAGVRVGVWPWAYEHDISVEMHTSSSRFQNSFLHSTASDSQGF
ncbi:unnamed protein product [Lactuca virosa]|uniref:Uncharacterized protein n=1 Tax=Lactuca virosa TaxID=75947 RepID=A0AAU9NXF4_9ASTR|nr:unnamed protein product [Lactuca virosa]